MTAPYYADETITLYHGDCREIMPTLDPVDLVVADPPYGETSLEWDRWPDGWPAIAAQITRQIWCFGSMRMFFDRHEQFDGWRFAQDVVWEKPRGTSFVADRFARVHEHVTHWYQGKWSEVYRETPRESHNGRHGHSRVKGSSEYVHGSIGGNVLWSEDGTRIVKSVLHVDPAPRGRHPTEKPLGALSPLIAYSCPLGGTVLDPVLRLRQHAGSCPRVRAPSRWYRSRRALLRGRRPPAQPSGPVRAQSAST